MIGATYAASAFADDADSSTSSAAANRVEVTGTYLRGIKQQNATPMTVIKTEDLTKQGIVNVEQAVAAIAANTSAITAATSVGTDNGGAAFADLRGLGEQYTLVLLDGRRMANQASNGLAVDLNAIPLATIDHIDVYKGGATATYGTDAIAGVINFVTKKSVQGATIEARILSPQHPGGLTKEVSVTGGKGSLVDDGFNVYGSFTASKSNEIKTTDRDFATNNLNPIGVSGNSFPANYVPLDGSGNALINPATGKAYPATNPIAPNCAPPTTVPYNGTCREQSPLFYGIQPEVEQYTLTGKASKQINEDNLVALQYIGTQTTTKTRVAPTPLLTYTNDFFTLPSSSPYFSLANAPAGTDSLELHARSIPAGDRMDEVVSTTQRIMATADGMIGSWAYAGGLAYSQNQVRHYLTGGYVDGSKLQGAFDDGTLNPFGDSAPGAWDSVALNGKIEEDKYSTTLADFHVNKDIYTLPAGAIQFAAGVEARHESLDSVFTGLAQSALSTGLESAQNTSGSRNSQAIFAQLAIPVTETLNVNLAARDDYFSDFGNTANPEVKFTWQPIEQIKFRGNASSGFRAPSLYNIYQPNQQTNTAGQYNDPLMCPNGNLQPGGNQGRDCEAQQQLLIGGSKDLKPEKSDSASFGFVIEPIKAVTASVDFWWTNIHDTIGTLSESAIFADPDKYADRFVRDPSTQKLLYVIDTTQNLGNTMISGIDLSATVRLPKTDAGNFSITYDGTYLTKFDYQHEKDGQYFHGIGQFSDYNNAPIFRYKQDLNLNWNKGNFSGILGSTYQTGYQDMYEGNRVASYILWNLSGTYVYHKDLTITAGIKNLFDKAPPYSNQDYAFQQGYDPRFFDSVGRAYYLQASYKM
ncbi:iron complex outermembrane receptor protein [Silvimonas terrae]|uniref:Iron complex outermembrane receptor protein n=1 Tax=Silvimonas terrae TaxID=300266 RepID=A0A840RH43_9NEIS|nr:TonB-dependent receptor [Silvimonas terrae]MBB5192949.1 iron complex outermembrane receptor protein [Silvimonas terrae]